MKRKNKFKILLTIILFFFLISSSKASAELDEVKLDYTRRVPILTTPYGKFEIKEPVIIDLINCSAMRRLKFIHQYGPSHYVKPDIVYAGGIQNDYTRYEHSLGVFALLRYYNRPLEEQIAGLLHDLSHTAFSHVADMLFKGTNGEAYQDNILEAFLKTHKIEEILNRHGFNLTDVLAKNGTHRALEQPLPNICADRLEYNLKGGLLAGLLQREDISKILRYLRFHKNKKIWYFTNQKIARKFALVSLVLTKIYTGTVWNTLMFDNAAKVLSRGLEIRLFSLEDITYNLTDDETWQKLRTSDDQRIQNLMGKITSPDDYYSFINPQEGDRNFTLISTKFRGIDPWIQIKSCPYRRLSQIDPHFREQYYQIKIGCERGWAVKCYDSSPSSQEKSNSPSRRFCRLLTGC